MIFDELLCKQLSVGFCDFSDVAQSGKTYSIWSLKEATRKSSLPACPQGQNCILPIQCSHTSYCSPI